MLESLGKMETKEILRVILVILKPILKYLEIKD